MNRARIALERLEVIQNVSVQSVDVSRVSVLIERYLENAVEFTERFGCGEGGAFFFDAAEIVEPGRILLSGDEDAILQGLPNWFSPFILNMCRAYLKWAKFLDEVDGLYLQFSELYDPLILLMEHGVFIWGVRQGELMVGKEDLRFPLRAWAARFSRGRDS